MELRQPARVGRELAVVPGIYGACVDGAGRKSGVRWSGGSGSGAAAMAGYAQPAGARVAGAVPAKVGAKTEALPALGAGEMDVMTTALEALAEGSVVRA